MFDVKSIFKNKKENPIESLIKEVSRGILSPKEQEIETIELNLLLEAILVRYGYDFRDYSKASMKRRIHNWLIINKNQRISEIISRLLYDENYFETMLETIMVTVTEMFRDPPFYKVMREKIVEYLQTYPYLKIWYAGCSTGEEVYSLAIFLKECDLYEQTTIFATDFNNDALRKAKLGIYPLKNIKSYTTNYLRAGGTDEFSKYYYAEYESVIMDNSLKKNITFANHNLVNDGGFGEMNLIICRNVLIYFNRSLQNKVLRLLSNSLIRNGFLCLGSKESLNFSDSFFLYDTIDAKEPIYQKKLDFEL